jgi:hypothetical protein
MITLKSLTFKNTTLKKLISQRLTLKSSLDIYKASRKEYLENITEKK